jgi:hypothetical protein
VACGLVRWRTEQGLAVAAAEQEDEALHFLSGWLARDLARRGSSLEDFVRHPAYGLGELHSDLQHFSEFGGVGGVESYFGHGIHHPSGVGQVRERLSVALAL